MKTFTENLTTQLDSIKKLMHELLDNSRIKLRIYDSYVFVVAPEQYWDLPNEKEQTL